MPDGHPTDSTSKIDFSVPHSARIWNYWMGGKDSYPVDRVAGDAWAEVHPDITTMAEQSRQFLIRVVRHLAGEAGIRQFLDIGTGLPTMQNTHEVAQALAPGSRVVYVDNDPIVLAHANALLTSTRAEGPTNYVEADVHQPEQIIAQAGQLLDLGQPVALILYDILGHVADFAEALSIINRLMAALPSGSYLTAQDSTNTSEPARRAAEMYAETGAVPYFMRAPEQLLQYFDGMELIEPGLVTVTRWRPGDHDIGTPQHIDQYGGVARKP